MSYISLYRKWRPLNFDEVVAQENTVRVLKNTVKSGKVAHAYLFCGTRGTGKTSIAKIFSRAINCLNPHDGNPCNECEICKGLLDGSLPDVMEIDAASNNGVDNIRAIIEDSVYSTFKAKYRIYIIDEVHMLSQGAFNALLKTLEEPPENVIFILATTEPQKLPATIISRCIRFNFKRIPVDAAAARLAEICDNSGVRYDDDALLFLARKGEGALRDSISLLDQTISSSEGYVTLEKAREATGTMDRTFSEKLALSIIRSNGIEILKNVSEIFSSGIDPSVMLSDLISVFRDVMVALTVKNPGGLVESSVDILTAMAKETSAREVIYFIKELSSLENRLKWSVERKTVFEAGLLSLCDRRLGEDADLAQRVTHLEERVSDLVASGIKTTAVIGPATASSRNYAPSADQNEAANGDASPSSKPGKRSSKNNNASETADPADLAYPAENQTTGGNDTENQSDTDGKVADKPKTEPEKLIEADKRDFINSLTKRGIPSAGAIIGTDAELYMLDDEMFVVFRTSTMMKMANPEKNRDVFNASASETFSRPVRVRAIMRSDYEDLKFENSAPKNDARESKKDETASREEPNGDDIMEELLKLQKEQGFEIVEE